MSTYTWFRKTSRFFSFITLSLVGTFFIFLFISSQYQVLNIEVMGKDIKLNVNREKLPNNLFFLDTEKLESQIEEDNPLIEKISIEKKYPNTIMMTVVKRSVIARLHNRYQKVLIDHNAMVVGDDVYAYGLPLIELDISHVNHGSTLTDQQVLQSIAFIELLNEQLEVYKITNYNSSSLQATIEETDILFPQNGELEQKVSTLQILLAGFRIRGSLPKIIDLRYSKPVIQI